MDASDSSTPSPPPARRTARHRVLDNAVARTVLSIWAWFVLGVVVIVFTPLVAVTWLVTVPFDKGRYAPPAGEKPPKDHCRGFAYIKSDKLTPDEGGPVGSMTATISPRPTPLSRSSHAHRSTSPSSS